MSDLISRKALIQSINTQILGMSGFAREIRQDLIEIVNQQQTAYDVDQVVEGLNNAGFHDGVCWNRVVGLVEAISIVKGAVKE